MNVEDHLSCASAFKISIIHFRHEIMLSEWNEELILHCYTSSTTHCFFSETLHTIPCCALLKKMLASVMGCCPQLDQFFSKTGEPFNCPKCIVFSQTEEIAVPVGVYTQWGSSLMMKTTNERQFSTCFIITPHCSAQWSDITWLIRLRLSRLQSQQRRRVVIKLTMRINNKWHKFVPTITTLPASKW